MTLSVRRNRTLRSILLCCVALLFAAQTLAVAHVHLDDSACLVCPHAHTQVAADATDSELADAVPGRSVQRAVGECSVQRTGTNSFQARAPPAPVR